ncbi:YidB family protein [Paraburkholderia guartelaensis]|uniref:YidB family protein n=1 Tax=Paraburkholderia TaxID=1822464 RepID=UPI003879D22C
MDLENAAPPSRAPSDLPAASPSRPSPREIVMSLLDTLGSLLGSQSQQQGGGQAQLLAAAMEFVNNQPGGLNGLIEKFQQGGLGDIVQSWVGNGENQPVSADQLHNVLGSDVVSGLAQKVGMQPDQVSGLLAQVLPHVVNAGTPTGEVPQGGQINTESVLGTLGGLASLLGGGNKQA